MPYRFITWGYSGIVGKDMPHGQALFSSLFSYPYFLIGWKLSVSGYCCLPFFHDGSTTGLMVDFNMTMVAMVVVYVNYRGTLTILSSSMLLVNILKD